MRTAGFSCLLASSIFYDFTLAAPAPVPTPSPASPWSNHKQVAAMADRSPCAELAPYALQYENDEIKGLRPSMVHACLTSIPFNADKAVSLIDWISGILQWQSTVDYLKNPPKDYQLKAVDLFGELERIRQLAATKAYHNEFEFENDLYTVFTSTGDGHLYLFPLLPTEFFPVTPVSYWSLSSNGIDAPRLMLKSDVLNNYNNCSHIVSINNKSVEAAFGLESALQQDLDAAYNNVVYNSLYWENLTLAATPLDWSDTTTFRFANGSSLSINNLVQPTTDYNLSKIISGQTFYDTYLLPKASNDSTGTTTSSTTTATPTTTKPKISPTPSLSNDTWSTQVAKTDDSSLQGLFLTQAPDVAVLISNSFEVDPQDFATTLRNFLSKCKAAGKSQLIIDVRTNGGGQAFLAYEMFRQLFPTVPYYDRSRLRANEALDAIGKQFSTLPRLTREQASQFVQGLIDEDDDAFKAGCSVFRLGGLTAPFNGASYKTWKDFYGPIETDRGSYTNYVQYDYANEAMVSFLSHTLPANGSANSTTPSAVFDQHNITLITNGVCASTCAIFGNLIRFLTNASTIAIGGRPNGGPMNLIGSTQGSQVYLISQLKWSATYALNISTRAGQPMLTPRERTALKNLAADSPISLGGTDDYGSVNLRDMFAPDSDVPLQFRNVPAGCRMYRVVEDVLQWENIYDRIAKGNYTCVWGKKAGEQVNAEYYDGRRGNLTRTLPHHRKRYLA